MIADSLLKSLRKHYHKSIYSQLVYFRKKSRITFPNFADSSSESSLGISRSLCECLGWRAQADDSEHLPGQTVGKRFSEITADYVEKAFSAIQHLRPGEYKYRTECDISCFAQYRHLSELATLLRNQRELATTLGHDYVITSDIVMLREPVTDADINKTQRVVEEEEGELASHTPLRAINLRRKFNQTFPILHASISCKWTIRSDRAQNARSEALNLIRHRKGHMPHIVVVTAEPLPTRIASLALGTGDLDCVYHFALPELWSACKSHQDQLEMLEIMVQGNRLRDISDLPFDLAM